MSKPLYFTLFLVNCLGLIVLTALLTNFIGAELGFSRLVLGVIQFIIGFNIPKVVVRIIGPVPESKDESNK